MSADHAPPGILCALITPFRDDQSPDWAPLKDLVDLLIDRGVHGLFVLGTTGEGPLLDVSERREVAEFVLGHVAGRVPVIVHCGTPDTKTAVELVRHAASNGATGVAAVVPYYFRYGEADLYKHFAALAEAAPGVGHYVYENPERVGYAAGVELVVRLVDEMPNVYGVKDTGDSIGKVTEYLARAPGPIDVYTGNNSTIFPALMVGARGSVSALANAVPELVVGVYESWSEGRVDESRALQLSLARLHGALATVPFVGAVKHLMKRRGLPSGNTRAPQPLLTSDQAGTLDRAVDSFADLRPWLQPVGESSLESRRAPAHRG